MEVRNNAVEKQLHEEYKNNSASLSQDDLH